ncbi:MAG TPA: MFS transporter [Longimicrobiaceae bacterium]|nr:MFS transporter [Longimicrobiaceae bacterium]
MPCRGAPVGRRTLTPSDSSAARRLAGGDDDLPGAGVPPRAPGPLLPDEPAPIDPAERSQRRGPFVALRHRNFAIFYWGQLLSLAGTWMQTTAQGWLVLELTNNTLLLGLVTAASSLPIFLFTLYAGVLADRHDKRRIITLAQTVLMLTAFSLAVLTHTGHIGIGALLVLVFISGTANAFEVPTRQSFFVELVGKDDLTNAIALNSSAFNATRIVGPAVAGALMGSLGVAACFYANGVSFLFVIAGLLAMRLPAHVTAQRTGSALEHVREGLAFIRGDRLVRTLVWMIAAMSVLAFPYAMLLPVFARDVLHVGASGLGWMLSASGVGALAAGLALAGAGSRFPRGRLMVASSIAFAVLLAAFALSRSFPLSLALLAAMGFTMILNNATTNALLQTIVPDALRGRVMSVYVFMFLGVAPLGSLQAGALARWMGAPDALAVGATAFLALVLYVSIRVPELRRVR